MSTLVLADHDGQQLQAATRNTVTAAVAIGGDVDVVVLGQGCANVAQQAAAIAGVNKVILIEHESLAHQLAENVAPVLVALAADYSHVLAPATSFGKNVLPRAAALLDVQQISEITAVIDADTFERLIYAGNAVATVKSADAKKLITVRTTKFDAASAEGGSASVESRDLGEDKGLSSFAKLHEVKSDRPELTTAGAVVSGGRGLGSKEDFEKIIDALAEKLDAAVGASRAAVDSGYAPNDYQVGQTGKVVAPELYVAVGISGAIQHLAGMKDSKVIVAINKDPDAPIFQVADYGLVADLFEAVPALTEAL